MRALTSRFQATLLAMSLAAPPDLAAKPPAREGAAPAAALPPAAETTKPGPPDPPRSISGDWWSRVQADLRMSEYRVNWQEKTPLPDGQAAYQAPNRAQDLRTFFTAEGVWWVPRTAKASWQVGLTLTSMGAGRRSAPVGEAQPEAKGNRVEYQRAEIIEWYVNDQRGVEQGFTVARRPIETEAQEPLRLVLSVSGNARPRLSQDGRAVEFLASGGVLALRYADLVVVDARGQELASRMELSECAGEGRCAVHLVVDDAGAAYPLTIDPLASSPNWTAEGNDAFSRFGIAVASAGDVNGDGFSDVIVGAERYSNPQLYEGRAYVYHGSASGLSATPNWAVENDLPTEYFGRSVGAAGDVNGDGYADVIVGGPYFSNGQQSEGRAYVYHGSASGLSTPPNWTVESNQADAHFGNSVGAAGDVNRDGYADVMVGASDYDNGQLGEGRAYVYHGSASGLSTTPNWTAESNQADAQYGWSVSTAGDVNRDGYDDVLVGARQYDNGLAYEGRAYAYHGSASGLSTTPGWTAAGGQTTAYFGSSVATAGDVNGDGYADVIVGASLYSNGHADEGRAFVYHGSASGLLATSSWTAEGNQADAHFGSSAGTAGDVNGDGYADVMVGASSLTNGQAREGRAFAYLGSASGLSAAAEWTAESDQAEAYFGASVATAGDVNGDGYADVIVGAPLFDAGGEDEGRAYVYHGSASALMTTTSWTAEGDQADAYFGGSVATAGDVNGDGYADVIVGAANYDNGQTDEGRAFVYPGSSSGLSLAATWAAESDQADAAFGLSVAAAGDVNGDGYADVIVGAPYDTNGQAAEGRAFLYHGSAAGLSATPSWTAEIDQPYAYFGWRVAGAGDVNGDGFADVVVGAVSFDGGQTNEGRALVYHGSAGGLSATPSWSREGDQVGAYFGFSVATAGDVNGDSYADLIVGASEYDNGETAEGRAYVYHGSAQGLSLTPSWTAESDQAGARFGSSVGTAGDVNGDAYADVIVGAPRYANGQTDEGRAYAYYGWVTGLSAAPNWTRETHRPDGRFGSSVGAAGDVDGDGYADVIVGAPYDTNGQTEEGRAYLYRGSASGLGLPSWMEDGDQAYASFGRSVGTAGDVNGDGYADVIVGASGFDNGEADEGRAFLFYGNTAGSLVRVRQARSNGTPIQPWGASWDPSGFRVRMTPSTWFGHGRMKLQVEVCPSVSPFGHFTCDTSTSSTWLVSGSSLNLALSGLSYGKLYRWRARSLFAPYAVTQAGITPAPNPPHGPWRRPSGQAIEADLRVLDPDLIFADGFETAPIAEKNPEDPDGEG